MSRVIAVLFLGPRNTRWGGGFNPTPRPPLPPGKTRYLFCRRLGGPQGRSGRAENLVPTGIQCRTVKPLVSRYTDWATRLTSSNFISTNYVKLFLSSPLRPHWLWVLYELTKYCDVTVNTLASNSECPEINCRSSSYLKVV